ncbi:MAG: sulfoxide reductase heme-binding subunit YedZ, partial [Kangiellaceae bacterium]|nr:sulfoxide reductase heme-binding subunit YedZ [Kangiellaceae bacterium]
VFLLLSLSITPLRRLSGVYLLIKFRRMLGLYSFFYLCVHILTYFAFYLEFRWSELGKEIIERPYITLGFLAWLLMIPLAITSTKSFQRRLGRKWAALHKLVYTIAALGLVHYIWQSKSDLNEPLIYVAWGILLMLLRVKKWRRFLFWRQDPSHLEQLKKGS